MKKYFLIFFFLIFCVNSFAQEKIVYLDVNYIISESEAGKYINKELKKINDKNIEEFKKVENSIKSEEENLLKQKNLIKEEEFNKKANELRDKYKSYQELKNIKNNDLKKLRDDAGNKILNIINEILSKYSTENKISLVLEKKNVIIGKSNLDISDNILNLLNDKIKKVEIKNE
tara:strand:- start:1219 stop:1740 length:522 start_codon:yes stop_codon:yes gene_type:complete